MGMFDDVPQASVRRPSRAPSAVDVRRQQMDATGVQMQGARSNMASDSVSRAQGAQSLSEAQKTAPARIIKTEAEARLAQLELQAKEKQNGFLTPQEQQSLAAARAVLMIEGQKQYKRGMERGYEPSSWGNKATAMLDKIPLFGKETATMLRSPEAELAVQGEGTFRQGALRSLTGQAGPVSEKADVQEIYFPSPFNSPDPEYRRSLAETRARQIAAARATAGPVLAEAYRDTNSLPEGMTPQAARAQAKSAIAAGKPRAAVLNKLKQLGVDTAGL